MATKDLTLYCDAVHASPHPTISGDVHSRETVADHVYKRRKKNHRRTGKAAPPANDIIPKKLSFRYLYHAI
jgi:hypothetical protein